MRIRDTFSGDLNELELEDPVQIYYCGLTVSDSPHLGHARGWIHSDVLRRFLKNQGYTVNYVENLTDINKKIFKKLSNEGVEADTENELANHYIHQVFNAMDMLNISRAQAYPRVSNHIPEIVSHIGTLMEEGYAYESNGSVYFNVDRFDQYGELSNQDVSDMQSQGDIDESEEKKNPADFALWKAVKPDKTRGQSWESPWGYGRPGWHIECSVMSKTHLDLPIDIHIGGQDLVFPHHENEIAQTESVADSTFAKNWMHIGLLDSPEDDEKMSSSRDNFHTVSSAVERYGSNPVRWFLLSSNYHSNQTYLEENIELASQKWKKVQKSYKRLSESMNRSNTTSDDNQASEWLENRREQIVSDLNSNLNTREALAHVESMADDVNNYLSENDSYDQKFLMEALQVYEEIIESVLGFDLQDENDGDGVVDDIVAYRDSLREDDEYDKADVVREALESAGLSVGDTDSGTIVS